MGKDQVPTVAMPHQSGLATDGGEGEQPQWYGLADATRSLVGAEAASREPLPQSVSLLRD